MFSSHTPEFSKIVEISTNQVNAWIEHNALGLSSNNDLFDLFDRLMNSLLRRANKTVSRVTLQAVLERAKEASSEAFLPFSSLIIKDGRILFTDLENRAEFIKKDELINGFRVMLTEFFSVIGIITGDLLLPSLFEEMSRASITNPVTRPKGLPEIQEPKLLTLDPHILLKTGIPNLDAILQGGIPIGTVTVFGGKPGSGKTISSQQIGFNFATPEKPVIFFQTLSEPTIKLLGFAKQFRFFDENKINKSVYFIDLGDMMRAKGLMMGVESLLDHLKRIRPALVVIDSFKAFEDLANSRTAYRKFCYEVIIKLAAWRCTSLLLGEFSSNETETSPLFSVVDGYFHFSQRLEYGEQQRFVQVVKMRGTDHNRDEHPIIITENGIEIYAPRVTLQRNLATGQDQLNSRSCTTGIKTLDDLIEGGIPSDSSILIAGTSGTGKTLLALEFLYRGAKEFNEKGIAFLFEETVNHIRSTAQNMGWDFDSEIKRGYLEFVSIPQPDILIEKDLMLIYEKVCRLGAKRVVIDSLSVLLNKVANPSVIQEKIYQLGTIVQKTHSVALFTSEIPFGGMQLSRLGIEANMVDGIILLTAIEEGFRRNRYLEVYKIRNANHKNGRYRMEIATGGITLSPSTGPTSGGRNAAA